MNQIPPARKRATLLALCLAAFIISLDVTIVNVALPTLVRQGATTGVGVATGPIIGGWLLEHYWWGSVFLFMVPVAAGVAALAAWAVPTSRDPRTRGQTGAA